MLYLLSIIISAFLLLRPACVMAGFFDDKGSQIQTNSCSECSENELNLNPDLRDKISAIEKNISGNLNKSANSEEIILFIDLSNNLFEQALNCLVKFKNNKPAWIVKGIIVGSSDKLKEKLLAKQRFFGSGIEFRIDLSGSLAKEFNIIKTPVYLVTYNGMQQRITGLSDFNEFASKLDK